MKKLKTIAIIGLLAISWTSNSRTSKYIEKTEGKNFKVMSYNIWNGFDWGKDVDRQKKNDFLDKIKETGCSSITGTVCLYGRKIIE